VAEELDGVLDREAVNDCAHDTEVGLDTSVGDEIVGGSTGNGEAVDGGKGSDDGAVGVSGIGESLSADDIIEPLGRKNDVSKVVSGPS
jgi:hypothetical protein